MPIKVLIKRHIKQGYVQTALKMLLDFRRVAMQQPGYISGETLTNHYDSRSVTIVSSWRSLQDWVDWQNSDKRAENEAIIERILEAPTKYEVFDIREPVFGLADSDTSARHGDEVS